MNVHLAPAPLAAPTLPTLGYMICAAPRTGSTLLAQGLTQTGRAGRPAEYFDIYDHNERFWSETLKIQNDAEYVDKVIGTATTPNGVFGLKLLWHQWPPLIRKLLACTEFAGAAPAESSPHALLSAKLGTAPRHIWIRREDKLAQAISYLRASRSGLWRSTDRTAGGAQADAGLAFDFDLITNYLRVCVDFDQRWEAYFRQHRLKVLVVTYENFIAAYQGTVMSVLEFLDLPREGVALPPPALQRQADSRSLEWRREYLRIGRERGIVAPRREKAAASPAAGEAVPPKAQEMREPAPKPDRAARPPRKVEPTLMLRAYQLTAEPQPLVRAGQSREWMDATPIRFAYRCLPMVIANQHGWFLLNRHKISVVWTGGPDPAALKIQFLSGGEPRDAVSLFGSGVLTFTVGYLLRTAPGFNLHVRGPANAPKDGIVALEGIVESDWTEATFTMNWKITRPNHPIVFEEGEPIAMVSPLRRGEVESFAAELHDINADPQLMALHQEWARSRAKHNADLAVPGTKARKDGWQRHYVRGVSIRDEAAHEHQTKLVLSEFADKRAKRGQ